jgi:hypothetical protein
MKEKAEPDVLKLFVIGESSGEAEKRRIVIAKDAASAVVAREVCPI